MNLQATKQDILKTLELIAGNHNTKPTESTIQAWYIGLSGILKDDLKTGLFRIIKERSETWVPTVAEFRSYCKPKTQNSKVEAVLAFSILLKNLNSSISPFFKDTAIAETVRILGGWAYVCGWLTTELPFRQREFVEIYQDLKESGKTFNPQLKGGFGRIEVIGFTNEKESKQALLEYQKQENLIQIQQKETMGKIQELLTQ